MRVLAFDQSLNHSAAVLLKSSESGLANLIIEEQFVHRPKSTGIFRMIELRVWIEKIVEDYRPQTLIREMHNQRTYGAASGIHAINGFIDAVAFDRQFLERNSYFMIPPGVWKKLCLGKGNIAKDTAYLVHVNKFLSKNNWLEVHNEFTVLDDNIADAICLGITGHLFFRFMRGDDPMPLTKAQENIIKKNALAVMDYGKL